MGNIILFIGFLGYFVGILAMIQNKRVAKFRKNILNMVSILAKIDLENNQNWERWYNEYEAVSYDEMFYKFWIPLNSYYQNIQQAYSTIKHWITWRAVTVSKADHDEIAPTPLCKDSDPSHPSDHE